jgi:endonuclease-3
MTLKERYESVINYFKTHVPVAETELNYSNPYELIVAVILSAQCTDKRINQVTPKLFKDYPNVDALSKASSDVIFQYIRSVSYPNNKANHLVNMAKMLLKDFNGVVPSEINDLVKLPGVGRKTANVVASVIYNKPAMAVDTHVFRVSNRLGLTKAKTPLQSELQLIKYIPKEYIATAHHWLILHGRYTCLARNPKCETCPISNFCVYYKTYSMKKAINPRLKKTAEPTVKKVVSKKVSVSKKIKFIPHKTKLLTGDKAPDFSAYDQNGNLISLKKLKGKKVILYFYPKDSTPTCTIEACNLRDEYKLLNKQNFVVLGVSADDEKSHKKFAERNNLPFSLLVDSDKKIINDYDVWGTKQFMGRIFDGILRTTFIINEKGIISSVITDVKSKEHSKQILSLNV